ncbi:MAG: Gfo/Idh/MocA family oxidoreductase [candidate division KSB1 bacterium]|nr:Gfo/Idh/MocA family oxidoreductase [candidate division KSB1 bacterium]
MNRRKFITTVGAVSFASASYSRILGANDRLNMALVGSGRRGRRVMSEMLKTGRAELRILCDVWDVQRQRAKDELGLSSVAETAALEETLARDDIDAVLIATPDHLHTNYAVQTLEAGKHLYLEKPVTLHYEENKTIKNAVKQSGMICQTGTQQRSSSHYIEAKERFFSDSNLLGDIVFIRTVWSDFSHQRRKIEPRPKPDHFDWERFLGPAPVCHTIGRATMPGAITRNMAPVFYPIC